MDLKKFIRNVPDFPKPGIQFKDITTLWKNADAFKESIDLLYKRYKNKGINKIVGAESRGFIVASPLAYLLNAGFVPVRKKGKLPYKKINVVYELEYGTDILEIHEDAIEKGEKVLVVDDLLATGGTMSAIVELVKKLGGEIIEAAFIVELEPLKGRDKLDIPVFSLIQYQDA